MIRRFTSKLDDVLAKISFNSFEAFIVQGFGECHFFRYHRLRLDNRLDISCMSESDDVLARLIGIFGEIYASTVLFNVVGQHSQVVVEMSDRVVLDRLPFISKLFPFGCIACRLESPFEKTGVHVLERLLNLLITHRLGGFISEIEC
jgi:hypothetical protein